MTQVDFYILPEDSPGPVLTACRLCAKAVDAGHRIYAYGDEPALLDDLDAALWTFRQGSFIAHERVGSEGSCSPLATVALGTSAPPDTHQDILLSLAAEPPPFFSRFERVLEIVSGDTEARAQARKRFAFYRERGYPLNSHTLQG